MTHGILLKHGWEIVSAGQSYTAYQMNDVVCVIWKSGIYKVYEVI